MSGLWLSNYLLKIDLKFVKYQVVQCRFKCGGTLAFQVSCTFLLGNNRTMKQVLGCKWVLADVALPGYWRERGAVLSLRPSLVSW